MPEPRRPNPSSPPPPLGYRRQGAPVAERRPTAMRGECSSGGAIGPSFNRRERGWGRGSAHAQNGDSYSSSSALAAGDWCPHTKEMLSGPPTSQRGNVHAPLHQSQRAPRVTFCVRRSRQTLNDSSESQSFLFLAQ